jgi:AcrR family transcriptional regulator
MTKINNHGFMKLQILNDLPAAGASPEAMVAGEKRRLKRPEQAIENRRKLLRAAISVIGEHGYAGATVSRITRLAGVAQGTFYLYFKSQQMLFDCLLSEAANEALTQIRAAVAQAPDFVTRETLAMRAFFHYAKLNPGWLRTFYESQVAAPAAYAAYARDRNARFRESLMIALKNGELVGYTEPELDILVQMLLASRMQLFLVYAKQSADGVQEPPEWVIQAYSKIVARIIRG